MTRLETTPEAHFVPGTNLKGAVDGANWCFLLPGLDLGRILSLGSPSPAALATLSKLGQEVAVWTNPEEHGRLRNLLEERAFGNVSVLVAQRVPGLPLPDDDVDVLLVADARLVRSHLGGAKLRAEVARVLKPTGCVYGESGPLLDRWYRRAKENSPFGDIRRAGRRLWIASASGEMRFAAPADDSGAVKFLEKRFLTPILRRQLLKRPTRVLSRSALMNRLLSRRALLGGGTDDDPWRGPPAYVRNLAAEAGLDIGGLRWAFAAPGEYSSQKVLMFLFEAVARHPRGVVKITRDSTHNFRLENEWRALKSLQKLPIESERTCPAPLFFGTHAGLAVLGQTAIVGAPFLQRTQATVDCPFGRRVVAWLLELGIATASQPESPTRVVARLQAQVDRFCSLYEPREHMSRFLLAQVSVLADRSDGLRVVFQHGDPGPWNLVVLPDGRPGFLDWEAADADGMPLWDIFHFLRSFGLLISQKEGRRDPVRSFGEQILAASALNGLLVETVRRFSAQSPLPPRLVEPLFYLCWVHRALKEASRLPRDGLESGRYYNLLRVAVEHNDAPGLQRLFSLPAAS